MKPVFRQEHDEEGVYYEGPGALERCDVRVWIYMRVICILRIICEEVDDGAHTATPSDFSNAFKQNVTVSKNLTSFAASNLVKDWRVG